MANGDQTFIDAVLVWLKANYVQLIVAAIVIAVSTILLIIGTRQMRKLHKKKKLPENYSKLIVRIFRFTYVLILIFSILIAFDITVGAISGVVALLGGTILGFAAINTLGNAIAGLIVMTSKPFVVGDRILYEDQYTDVQSVELMYTKLRKLDNSLIVVPNQELLNMDITNFGQIGEIRRSVAITSDYDTPPEDIRDFLLDAVSKVEGVLESPEPSVSLTEFQNYAAEYKVFYSVSDIKSMHKIDSNVRITIFTKARKIGLDLRTPILSKNLSKAETSASVKKSNDV